MNIDQNGFLSGSDTMLPEGFLVGSADCTTGQSGCTVILCPKGATASCDIRGAAPATRETDLLNPENSVQTIHAVMLSGGSAFGLDSCSGAMRWLSEHNCGLDFANAVVPLVVGASLFDLHLNDQLCYPDAAIGYAACNSAGKQFSVGHIGAGRGASVGKLLGPTQAMPGGLGACSFVHGELIVSAIVAVNALGNVYDASSGNVLAGTLDPLSNNSQIIDPLQAYAILATSSPDGGEDGALANTTLGCVLTNAKLTKVQAKRCSTMAHDGFARAIHPIHTSFDGDAIFCMAAGNVSAHPDMVGTLAALAMEHAIHNAVCADV